jgi:hypothetical protein
MDPANTPQGARWMRPSLIIIIVIITIIIIGARCNEGEHGAWREAVADAVERTQPGTQLTSHRAHQLVDYAGRHANHTVRTPQNNRRSNHLQVVVVAKEEETAPVA